MRKNRTGKESRKFVDKKKEAILNGEVKECLNEVRAEQR